MRPAGSINHRTRPAAPVHTRTRSTYPTVEARPGGPVHLAIVPTGTVNRPAYPRAPIAAEDLFTHFTGQGTLTTAIFPKHRATPGFAGEGDLSIVTTQRHTLPMGFGGAGQLSLLVETIGGNPIRDIDHSSEATLTVDAVGRLDAGTADATGSGTLTVDAVSQFDVEGSFYTSEGTLTVASNPRHIVTADFTAAGGLAVDLLSAAQAAAPFAGAGTLSAAVLPRLDAGGVALAGAGALTVVRGKRSEDLFTRSNSSNLGSTWSQGGTGSGIGVTSNNTSWGNGGGTDGSAWAIRTEDTLTGDHYVRVVVQTASASRASRLILHAGSALTTGHAYLNWFSGAVYFGRSTSSYTSITDMASVTSGITIAAGDVLEFWNVGNVFHFAIDGVEKGPWTDSGNLIARDSSHRRQGFGQDRQSFANSGFIQEWRGGDYTAAAA